MLSPNIFSLTNHEVYLITTAHEGKQAGMIATWLTLCSIVPEQPRIMAAISPCNFTYELISKSQKFVVHLLAEGQESLLPIFGLESSKNVNKFLHVDYSVDNNNIPIISNSCGYVSCELIHQVDCGDRIICIADIFAQKLEKSTKPLCKNTAFAQQSQENLQKLLKKRHDDGIRDVTLKKNPRTIG